MNWIITDATNLDNIPDKKDSLTLDSDWELLLLESEYPTVTLMSKLSA